MSIIRVMRGGFIVKKIILAGAEMRSPLKYSIIIYCLLLTSISYSQEIDTKGHTNRVIDSLLVLSRSAKDTSKVFYYNKIGWEFMLISENDLSLKFAHEAQQLSKSIHFKKGESIAYTQLGSTYADMSNFTESLKNYFIALKLAEELNEKEGIATIHGLIGIDYKNQQDYTRALDNYFQELKILKEGSNKKNMGSCLTNIGLIYVEQASLATNGSERSALFGKALENYFQALKIAKEIGSKRGIAIITNNMGNVYEKVDDLGKALDSYQEALKMNEEMGNKLFISINSGNIGMIYMKTKQYPTAEKYLQRALSISVAIGDMEGVKENNEDLSTLYDREGKYESAFEFYKRSIAARDSITSDENTKKQTRIEMQYEFDKKQSADSISNAEHAKQETLKHDEEIKQQRLYTFGGGIGFVLMLIVAGVSFRAYKNKQKANEIIFHQKELVEEKQKEILDSIHYAKRIQRSLLPTEKYIQRNLNRMAKI